ncbi:hypothetical protein [Nostoc sp. MG11]|uniref:hypothetical protein n=1 Tax=Nostoc sp. MG11 TaxID=2721166 RepID=UPI001D02479C|nr:hypothetical protein [Nostoc sp. MG11]
MGHLHPHDIVRVNSDGNYILRLAIVRIIGLIDDGCNDGAIAVGQRAFGWGNRCYSLCLSFKKTIEFQLVGLLINRRIRNCLLCKVV